MVVFIIVSPIPVPPPAMDIMSIIPVASIVVDGFTLMGVSRSVRYSVSGVSYSYWIPERYCSSSGCFSSSQCLNGFRSFSVMPFIQALISSVIRLPE